MAAAAEAQVEEGAAPAAGVRVVDRPTQLRATAGDVVVVVVVGGGGGGECVVVGVIQG